MSRLATPARSPCWIFLFEMKGPRARTRAQARPRAGTTIGAALAQMLGESFGHTSTASTQALSVSGATISCGPDVRWLQ